MKMEEFGGLWKMDMSNLKKRLEFGSRNRYTEGTLM
jgi:hypothetical protein